MDGRLLADAELVDDRAVALVVDLLEVVEKTTPTPDELQEAAAAVMILRVRLEVVRQIRNAAREECDLHFWGAGIAVMRAILGYELRFLLLRRGQNLFSLAGLTRESCAPITGKSRHHNSGRSQNQSQVDFTHHGYHPPPGHRGPARADRGVLPEAGHSQAVLLRVGHAR